MMENLFKNYFEIVCKIQKKWENINVIIKKDLPPSVYQIEAIGPFAYFTFAKQKILNFILFMPEFSPVAQNENTIHLVPNIEEGNLHYILTFSKADDLNSFLKYWYESLILVEDMLRAIVLKKYPHSEKILMYNKKAKLFQEVFCVIQAISSLVVFQTQIFNGAVISSGVSVDITKNFTPGIVTPLNTIVPQNKRLLSFYITGKKKNEKHYFVCPNKESLMQWILILHGLGCQAKYTDKAIDEQNRYQSLIDKIKKTISEVNPSALPTKNENSQTQVQEQKSNQNKENLKDENTNNNNDNNNDNDNDNNNDNDNDNNNDKIDNDNDNNNDNDNENNNDKIDNDENGKELNNNNNNNELIQEEEEEVASEKEEKSHENSSDHSKEEEEREEGSASESKEEEKDSKEEQNVKEIQQQKHEDSEDSDEPHGPTLLRNLVSVESILPDSIDFGNREDEKPQVFEEPDESGADRDSTRKSKKILSIIGNGSSNNEASSAAASAPRDESAASSNIEDKTIGMINPNAYDENADYYYNMWFEKPPPTSAQPPQPSQPPLTISNEAESQIKARVAQQQAQRGRHQRNNSATAASSYVTSSYVSTTSSCISTEDEPLDVSDDESNGGVLSELGERIFALVSEKDATGAIAEAIAATSDEKPISEDDFNAILDELKKTEVKQTSASHFELPSISPRVISYAKENAPQYLEDAISILNKNEVTSGEVTNSDVNESDFLMFEDQFMKYEVNQFDQILSDSIEKINDRDEVNFDFFDFSSLPTGFGEFDSSLLNAYDTPSSPFFTDLMIEINNVLKIDKKKSVTNENARKFTYLLAALFLNGLQQNVTFYEALKKLQESLSLIVPIVQSIRESDPQHEQALSFVNQFLERNLLFLVFREIQRNDEWIKKFYRPSSLMLYGSQLTDIIEELSKLRGYEFRLSNSPSEPTLSTSDQNLTLKANLSNQIANAVNVVISSASSLSFTNENMREFESIVEKYGDVPAFPFVVIDDCDGSPEQTVRVFIDLLKEGQSAKSLITSAERNAWKFISEVAEIENNKSMKDFEMFRNKFAEFKGASFIDANRNVAQKMESFLMDGYKMKKLHVWFLILASNRNVANKFYRPDASVVDMFRIRHVVSKLMMIMNKVKD